MKYPSVRSPIAVLTKCADKFYSLECVLNSARIDTGTKIEFQLSSTQLLLKLNFLT